MCTSRSRNERCRLHDFRKTQKDSSNYGVDENEVEAEGFNYEKFIEFVVTKLNAIAKEYSEEELLKPEQVFIKRIENVFQEINQRRPSDFITLLLKKQAHIRIASVMKMTLSGRSGSDAEADEKIVLGVLDQLLKAMSSFKTTKDAFADSTEGTSSQVGLGQLPDLFNKYGYKDGVAMANQMQGSISLIRDEIEDINNSIEFQEKNLQKMRSKIKKDSASGKIEFGEKFAGTMSGGAQRSAVVDILKTKVV